MYTNNCFGFKRHFKKLLKTIEPKDAVDISDNIYGYSAVIAGKPVKLEAVSKDFTCAYSIDRASFLECVHENKLDTEYYFEIKAKLDASRYIEGFEAPAILNIRQHYRPSEMFIIKRNAHRLRKHRNRRKDYMRNNRSGVVSSTRLLLNSINNFGEDVPTTSNEIRLTCYEHCQEDTSLPPENKNSFSEERTLREETSQASREVRSMFSKEVPELSKEAILTSYFEGMKEYHKYYKRSNISHVLDKLERSNYVSTEYV